MNVAIVKDEAPFYIVAAGNAVLATTDWCKKVGVHLSVPTERLSKVTLVDGERRKEVKPEDLTMHTSTDLSWPDDSLLELEYLATP